MDALNGNNDNRNTSIWFYTQYALFLCLFLIFALNHPILEVCCLLLLEKKEKKKKRRKKKKKKEEEEKEEDRERERTNRIVQGLISYKSTSNTGDGMKDKQKYNL